MDIGIVYITGYLLKLLDRFKTRKWKLYLCPQMTLEEYGTLEFEEVDEMTAMWKHYW